MDHRDYPVVIAKIKEEILIDAAASVRLRVIANHPHPFLNLDHVLTISNLQVKVLDGLILDIDQTTRATFEKISRQHLCQYQLTFSVKNNVELLKRFGIKDPTESGNPVSASFIFGLSKMDFNYNTLSSSLEGLIEFDPKYSVVFDVKGCDDFSRFRLGQLTVEIQSLDLSMIPNEKNSKGEIVIPPKPALP